MEAETVATLLRWLNNGRRRCADLRACCGGPTALLFFIQLASYSASALNDAAAAAPPAGLPASTELSQMTLEQLMNVQVTSVSRRPQRLIHAAAAIQEIAQNPQMAPIR